MLSIFKKEKKPAKAGQADQATRPAMQRIHRKRFSLDENLHDFHVKYEPLETQSVYKHDATTWRWLAEHDYSIDTELGPRKLATQLKSSKKIQKLNVEFQNCQRMSGSKLFYIAHSLKRLACLKTFRFSFDSCRQITDEGLYHLCEGLKRDPQLQNLSLSFMNMLIHMTDKGVHWLSNCVKKLPNLKNLELSFEGCFAISDVGLNSLSNSLKNLRKLEGLSLSFSDCG